MTEKKKQFVHLYSHLNRDDPSMEDLNFVICYELLGLDHRPTLSLMQMMLDLGFSMYPGSSPQGTFQGMYTPVASSGALFPGQLPALWRLFLGSDTQSVALFIARSKSGP